MQLFCNAGRNSDTDHHLSAICWTPRFWSHRIQWYASFWTSGRYVTYPECEPFLLGSSIWIGFLNRKRFKLPIWLFERVPRTSHSIYEIPFSSPSTNSRRLANSSNSTTSNPNSTPGNHADSHSRSVTNKNNATTLATSNPHCRYTVLSSLAPYIKSFITLSLASDLLDLYFTEPSTLVVPHPL
jgi:hypothetical protein